MAGSTALAAVCSGVEASGDQIAFTSNRNGNFEIFVVTPDGLDAARRTPKVAWYTGPAWSPDGREIAFSSKRDGGADDIVVVDVGTGDTRRVARGASGG